MRKFTPVALFALGLAMTTMPAHAENDDWGWQKWGLGEGPSPGMMMEQGMMGRFGASDSNNDGVIGADEATAQAEYVFATMDADDDGDITGENSRMCAWAAVGG